MTETIVGRCVGFDVFESFHLMGTGVGNVVGGVRSFLSGLDGGNRLVNEFLEREGRLERVGEFGLPVSRLTTDQLFEMVAPHI